MKIAIATDENKDIYPRFGSCPLFTVVELNGNNILSRTELAAEGTGHTALTELLTGAKAELVICGGIGEGAHQALTRANIAVISGIQGSIDDAIAAYLVGLLHV